MKTALRTPSFVVLLLAGGLVLPSWTATADTKTPLIEAYRILVNTASGREILAKAHDARIPVIIGRVSKTDITATRVVENQQEKLKYDVQVQVSADKEPVFQALDLAHELTHALHPKKNPFDPNLNASDYIRHGIESEGGEANAIQEECTVGKEIVDSGAKKMHLKEELLQVIKARCQFVWKTSSDPSRWKQSFYNLGQYYREFTARLKQSAVATLSIDSKSPIFSSAVAHKPYPLALLEEYVEITHTICARARQNQIARRIANVSGLESRCREIE